MTAESAGGSLPTIRFAKAKTALQMTYLGLFLLTLTLQYLPETQALAEAFLKGNVMYGFMIMVVVVTCLSALSYIRIYLKNVTIANE